MNGNDQKVPEPPQPQFKGVWICAEIWEHPDLTYAEKFLIAEIDSLSGKGKACFASNEFLAKRILQKLSHANNLLSSLTTRGFVIRLHFDGRETKRCVHPDISSNPRAAKALLNEYGITEPTLEQPSSKSESSFLDLRGESKKLPSSQGETESSSLDTNREKTKTPAREQRTPAKRKVRRGSQESSSSFSLSVNGGGEGEKVTNESVQRTIQPSPELFALVPEDQPVTIPLISLGIDPLLAEFGPFNSKQRKNLANAYERDPDYVMCKAEIVRSEPRKNLARALIAALRDNWQPAQSTLTAKSDIGHGWVPSPPETQNPPGNDERSRVAAGLAAWRSEHQ